MDPVSQLQQFCDAFNRRIVERGTHQERLAQRGRYFNLYTMQWAQSDNV